MNISGWPYPVTVNGDVEGGGAVSITLDLAKPASTEVDRALRYAVETFAVLARAGGLGGDRVEPARSTAIESPAPPLPGGTRMTWDFTAMAIDPRGLAVLFNMFAFLCKDIRAVSVQALGAGPRGSFTAEDLPPMWSSVPFGLDDDRSYGNVELTIEFVSPVPAQDSEAVLDALGVWLDAGSVQGFRDWTEKDERSFLAPTTDPPFELAGDTLSGHLEDSGIAEGGYDILVNVMVKLNATVPVFSVALI